MTLADDVNLEEFVMTKDEFSGADIKAICTEAGLLALRERRMKVTNNFFVKLLNVYFFPLWIHTPCIPSLLKVMFFVIDFTYQRILILLILL